MRQDCIDCKSPTIRAREIDNNIIRVDAESVPDGEVAVVGDLDHEPTAFWNFDEESARFFNITSEWAKHNRHVCPVRT